MPWTLWAGAVMGRQQATRWAARPHCLHVAEQATLARAPPDLRAAPRGAPYSSGRQLAWVGRCSFLQGPEGPGDKVPETPGQGCGREEELGQRENLVAITTRYLRL